MSGTSNLMSAVEQQLGSGSLQLPVYSATAAKLQAIVADEATDARAIECVLGNDPALAVQVLRVANSPYYGGLSKAQTISAAAQRLGLRQVVNIAVLTAQRAAHATTDPRMKALMQRLWQHAVGCAIGAKWLAERANCREQANEAFLGGLLHDVGSLLLMRVIESLGSAGGTSAMPDHLIVEVMDAFHAEQGARLVEHWGLPECYREICASHHSVEIDAGATLVHLVRLADQACKKIGVSLTPDPTIRLSTLRESEILGMREIALAELEIAIEDGINALA